MHEARRNFSAAMPAHKQAVLSRQLPSSCPPFGGQGIGADEVKALQGQNRLAAKLHITLPAKKKLLTGVFLTPSRLIGRAGGGS